GAESKKVRAMIAAFIGILIGTCGPQGAVAADLQAETGEGIWREKPGHGFRKNARTAEVKVGRAFGTTEMGSKVSHDLWMSQLQAGLVLSDVLAPNRWFSGNVEGTGHILVAGQDQPNSGYLTGLDVGLRYHLVTKTRLVPFIAGSIGVG